MNIFKLSIKCDFGKKSLRQYKFQNVYCINRIVTRNNNSNNVNNEIQYNFC